MCPDHGLQDISDLEDLAIAEIASSLVCSCDPVGSCKDRSQVVRGVAPLGSEPAVVKVEPSDHGTNVEGTVYGVELVVCARHLGAIGDGRSFHDGTKDLPALLEAEAFKTAAQGVNEDPASSVVL